MRAASVETRSPSETMPASMRTRPSDLRLWRCSSRAVSSCSSVTRPRSRRSVPSWFRVDIAVLGSPRLGPHGRQEFHQKGAVKWFTFVVDQHTLERGRSFFGRPSVRRSPDHLGRFAHIGPKRRQLPNEGVGVLGRENGGGGAHQIAVVLLSGLPCFLYLLCQLGPPAGGGDGQGIETRRALGLGLGVPGHSARSTQMVRDRHQLLGVGLVLVLVLVCVFNR